MSGVKHSYIFDIIFFLWKRIEFTRKFRKIVKAKIRAALVEDKKESINENDEEKINYLIELFEMIFLPKYQHLITLFKFSTNEIVKNSVDVAILQGLLRSLNPKVTDKNKELMQKEESENYHKQLMLCLSWNQYEFAKENILIDLNKDKVWWVFGFFFLNKIIDFSKK